MSTNDTGSRRLRRVLGEFATGVTVVAADSPRGPVGMTVNSFTSVSLDPPLILVCLATAASTTRAVTDAGSFAVSILRRDQRGICDTFAARRPDKFSAVGTVEAATGAPVIDDALAYLDCRVHDVLPAGDHVVVIGEVADAAAACDGEPLTFFRGTLQ
ncbi:flavin reductase family protein [Dactylosporangium sp. NBC_01737]|uniref:flavin reductase family protein n=1 Tax=Dactylosporangium sp. NBC_01737 TaxID=2975959 RepID=UPI002E0D4B55|nr:flavin reductase family protein [Dactylosporangium sp. NBC_01737]